MQHRVRLRDGLLGELHHVGGLGEGEQVAALRPQRGRDDVIGVRAIGVENVVAPVGVEDGAVGFAILTIRGFPVVGTEHHEEIGKKVDQHETQDMKAEGENQESMWEAERRNGGNGGTAEGS